MRAGRSGTAILVVLAAAVLGLTAYATNALFSGLTAAVETNQFVMMQAISEDALRAGEGRALARAEMIAALPATKRLMAAQDRVALLAEYAPMFAIQKEKYGIAQGQFHVPPATSLLRLHAPDSFGDDLSKFRPMVLAANRDKASKKGFAIARSGPAIFGVAPVTGDDGTHLGTFELGIDFGPVLDALKANFGLDAVLYVEEKPLREFAAGLDPAILSDQNRVGRFIRFYATNKGLMAPLTLDSDLAPVSEPVRFTRTVEGQTFGVLLLPIKNAAGDSVGVLAVAGDFSASRSGATEALVWQIAYAVFGFIVLAGGALIVLRGLVLRPAGVLAQRLEAGAPLVEDSDRFPAEIAALAAAAERAIGGRAS
jgi:methyl-accepting chemotaxis protein